MVEPFLEQSFLFLRANQVIMDVASFYSNRPTSAGIQAITECERLRIDRSTWQRVSEVTRASRPSP